jgi:tRNA nucleotidyltransferase (CCA-adding enzyme)
MVAAGEHMLVSDYERLRTGTKVDLLLRMEAKRLTTRMFKLAAADSQNQDLALLRLAKRDLRAIRKVKLPDDKRDLGEKSGELLRQLRCEAIAARDPDA